jgi:hypothetical protein
LRTYGWPKVERVLQAIDDIEALGIDPADVAPDHWRHIIPMVVSSIVATCSPRSNNAMS